MPTQRAPRRASHDDTYAVPQPSSMASLPSSSSGSTCSSASGTDQTPQAGSSAAQSLSPLSTNSLAHSFHASLLRRMWSAS